MDTKDRVNKYCVVIDERTGDVISNIKATDIMKSIAKENQIKGLKAKKDIEDNLDYIILEVKNGIYAKRWVMYYTSCIKGLGLTWQEEGVLSKLVGCLRNDGSGTLYGETTKKYWYGYLKMKPETFNKYYKILESHGIVSFKRGIGILINPYYYRYGRKVDKSLLEIFKLYVDERGELQKIPSE